jgi:hypothetical protein
VLTMLCLVVAGVLSVAMNFWGLAEADRRRRIIQGATIVAGLVTVIGAVWGYRDSEADKRELKAKLDDQTKASMEMLKNSNVALTKLTELQTAHQQLTSQVARVVVAAQKVKPGATQNEALDLAAQRLATDVKHLNARVDQVEYRTDLLSSMQLTMTRDWKTTTAPVTAVVDFATGEIPAELKANPSASGAELVANQFHSGHPKPNLYRMSIAFDPVPHSPLLGHPISAVGPLHYMEYDFCSDGPGESSLQSQVVSIAIALTVNGISLPTLHTELDCGGGKKDAKRLVDISKLTAGIDGQLHKMTAAPPK